MCNKLITILGPTASGKTALAVKLAKLIGTEILSADSRQVYQLMDIGTGKDIEEYDGVKYHLIDIVDVGEKYNVYRFQKDFYRCFSSLQHSSKPLIMCGGSGMYLDSILSDYQLLEVPENSELREQLEVYSIEQLSDILSQLRPQHNQSDIDTKSRTIRAIEIAKYQLEVKEEIFLPKINNTTIGVNVNRDIRRERITERLKKRLKQGMVEEIEFLLKRGVNSDDLIYYGLEYKYVTQYVLGEISYELMFEQLNGAIHKFAKRQMTFFRHMERKGCVINWIDGNGSIESMYRQALNILDINKFFVNL